MSVNGQVDVLSSKKDTMQFFKVDSLNHDFGKIHLKDTTLIKNFQYSGTDSAQITKVWTSDPHMICDFPKQALLSDTTYRLAFCFLFKNRPGPFTTTMGLDFSNGKTAEFRFTGRVEE